MNPEAEDTITIHSYDKDNEEAKITEDEDREFIHNRLSKGKEDDPGSYKADDIDFVDIEGDTNEDEYSAKIHIEESDEEDDSLLLSSEGFVGLLKLPSGKKIEIKPKESAEELDDHYLSMWGYVNFGSGWEYPKKADLGTGEAFLNSMGEILDDEINQIIRKGLNKDYVKVRDETRYLKGKLLAKEQMRSHTDETFNVEYEEISRDNPLNQLLLFATDRLRKMTSGDTSNKLDRKYGHLRNEAELKSEAEILSKLDEIAVDSTNSYYQTAVDISKKVVRNTYYSSDEGQSPAYSFLIDMNYLFEEFVRELLDEIYDSAKKEKEGIDLFKRNGRQIEPDLLLNGELIGDVKYKDKENIERGDYYQVITYSTIPEYNDNVFIVFIGGESDKKVIEDSNRAVHLIGLNIDKDDEDIVKQVKDQLMSRFEDREGIPAP